MRLPPSWRLVGRARARLIGRARARMYAGCGRVFGCGLGVRPHVCGLVVGAGSVVAEFVCERARRGASVARGSNALDGEAMH